LSEWCSFFVFSAEQPAFKSLKGEDLKNIFVGNLDFGVREEAVRSLFETYGAVERVSIMTDRETGRSRGFAFVEMANDGEAERAITALNGTNLSGRALNVNEARPKTERGPRPGGGAGGGGKGFGGGGFRDREGGGGGGGGHSRQRREPRW
jgi:RNA recognition motif-containing protein